MDARKVFASAEAFDEWFQVGTGDKEKEAEVVEQLHKVITPILPPPYNLAYAQTSGFQAIGVTECMC